MVKARRPVAALIVAALLALAGTGCWDRQELEDLALVLSLGIDALPGGRVELTAQIAVPTRLGMAGGGAGQGGGQGSLSLTVTRSGVSIADALKAINRVVNRRLTLAQNRLIVFGEATARQGLGRFVAVFARYREFRRTMQIIIVKGRAKEIMSVRPEIEKNPTEYLLDLAVLSYRSSETAVTTVNDFIRDLEGLGSSPFTAYLVPPRSAGKQGEGGAKPAAAGKGEQGSGAATLGGVAVFRGGRMAGTLSPLEAASLLILAGRFNEDYLTIPDPLNKGRKLTFNLTSAKPTIMPHLRQGKSRVEIHVKAEADLVGAEAETDYATPENEVRVEHALAGVLKRRLLAVIQRARREFRADPFGLGEHFRPLFPTWSSWSAFRWPDRFPATPASVTVRVHLRRFGLQRQASIPSF